MITVFYIQHHKTILDNIGVLGLCVTVLILVAIGCSSLLSRLVKNNAAQRRTVIASSPLIFANYASMAVMRLHRHCDDCIYVTKRIFCPFHPLRGMPNYNNFIAIAAQASASARAW